jgi:hypothetical protein
MQEPINVRSAERKAFQTTVADGLWDVFIGCFFLEFAIAPLFSKSLGDFWSSVIFLPFFGMVYLGIYLVRKNVVAPRIGTFKYGKPRQKKLKVFTLIMVVLNLVIFLLGLIAYFLFDKFLNGFLMGALLGIFIMVFFSAAAYFLEYPRLYLYGSLIMLAPLVGEWLYAYHGASHHGYPIVFGSSAGFLILIGLITFARLIKNHPQIEIPEGE